MMIDYITLRNNLYDIIISNDNLNPSKVSSSYVHQVLKQRVVPGPSLPAILVYVGSKTSEVHRAIGYSPYPRVILVVRTVTIIPNPNPTPNMLMKLGLTKITTPEDSDSELAVILDELESTLRADDTVRGQEIRRLNNAPGVKVAIPISVNFGQEQIENALLNWTELIVEVSMRLA